MDVSATYGEGVAGVMALGVHGALMLALAYASVVDARTRLVPRGSLIVGAAAWVVGVALGIASGTCPFFLLASFDGGAAALLWILECMAGGVVTAGVALVVSLAIERRSEGAAIGGGDIKLLFVVGLYAGPLSGFGILGVSCVLALAFQGALAMMGALMRVLERRRGVPPCCMLRPGGTPDRSSLPLFRQSFAFVPFITAATCVILIAG